MVEYDDIFDESQSEGSRIKTFLRMNVANVKKYVKRLKEKSIKVDCQ